MFFIFFSFKKGYFPFHYNIIFRTSCKSVGFAFISSVIFLFIDCFTSQSHANPKGTQSEGGQSSRDAERMTKNFSHAIYFYFFEIYYKFIKLKLFKEYK